MGPENKPIPKEEILIFIKFWSEPENWKPQLLGFFKSNFIGQMDYNAIIDAMTSYMHNLGLWVKELHLTLGESKKPNVTHENWIAILKECLPSLVRIT